MSTGDVLHTQTNGYFRINNPYECVSIFCSLESECRMFFRCLSQTVCAIGYFVDSTTFGLFFFVFEGFFFLKDYKTYRNLQSSVLSRSFTNFAFCFLNISVAEILKYAFMIAYSK